MNCNYFETKLAKFFENISLKEFFENFKVARTKIYKLFLEKRVYINNEIVYQEYIIKENDVLKIDILNLEYIDFLNYKKALNCVYEDDFILIINKPKNILVHPDSKNNQNTLVNMVSNYYQENNINRLIRYPHRLDYDTTGLILFSKIFFFQSYLDNLLFQNKIKRFYHLFVCGNVEEKGKIDFKIQKNKKLNKMEKSIVGLESSTNYTLITAYENYSLVEAILDTGRMHQIRCHFSLLNKPLIGDDLYGTKIKNDRYLLHSKKIIFFHPFLNKDLEIEIDYPEDFNKYLL